MKNKRKQNDLGNIDGSWTLPTVVVISGAVNKKAKDKKKYIEKNIKEYIKWIKVQLIFKAIDIFVEENK